MEKYEFNKMKFIRSVCGGFDKEPLESFTWTTLKESRSGRCPFPLQTLSRFAKKNIKKVWKDYITIVIQYILSSVKHIFCLILLIKVTQVMNIY